MEIINFAKHVISTILAILYLPVSFIVSPTEGYEVRNPDELITSFSVVSDIHIEGNNYPTFVKYAELLREVNSSKNNDTLVFLGDNTMNGQGIESFYFYTALKLTGPAENLIVAPGNHDFGNGTGVYEKTSERFLKYANFAGCDIDNSYYYKVINDCYFIVLSSESDTVNSMDISDEQLGWLKNVLDQASENNNPIFVFSHHPINYIDNGSYDRISGIINDYDNVICFSGHTHLPLTPYSVSEINGVKAVNIPRSVEDYEDEYGSGIGAVVEVYDNEVLLRFRDFDDGKWVEGYEYTFAY